METNDHYPEKQVLSVDDVLRIIEGCSKGGVTVLKFCGLELNFGPSQPGTLPPLVAPSHWAPLAQASQPETAQEIAASAARELEQSEYDLKQQQMQELLITNPAEFERQMNQGDLEDDSDESADDEHAE